MLPRTLDHIAVMVWLASVRGMLTTSVVGTRPVVGTVWNPEVKQAVTGDMVPPAEMPNVAPGKAFPTAKGFGRFRMTSIEPPAPPGRVRLRPGIGTNEAEVVECVPVVCAYRAIVAFRCRLPVVVPILATKG